MNSGFRFRGMGRANGQVIGIGRPELGVSVKALVACGVLRALNVGYCSLLIGRGDGAERGW